MQRSVSRRARSVLVAAAAAVLMGGVAFAQIAPITFAGGVQAQAFKVRKNIAIPAYEVNFLTVHEANSIATMSARTRLNWVLTGIPMQTMKRLTNEGHADLKAKLTAAGLPVLPDDQARALAAGLEPLPGNMEVRGASSFITLGQQVKHGWASFGADAAPALKAYHNPSMAAGGAAFGAMNALQANGRLGGAARAADALVVMPHIIIDFADMNTKVAPTLAGGTRASAAGKVQFSIRAASATNLVIAMDRGAPFMQGLRMSKDATSEAPFATVLAGEAAVKELTGTPTDDYGNATARGDAIKADPAAWEALVRKALQDYNTALVAAIVKGRG